MKKNIKLLTLTASLLCFTQNSYCKDFIVIQKDKNFSIQNLKVKMGDTIIFKNEEKNIVHNVYSVSKDNNIDMKVQQPGKSSEIEIDAKHNKKGVMELQCAIHPNMKMRVEIE